ncbi:DUF6584 family protein [Dermacoccaceae bacterium W4C1]
MTIERTMERARADIAGGDAGMAVRRLGSLRAAYPDDLEVRRALREACRARLDPAEAGRWGFVLPDTSESELQAFAASRGHHGGAIGKAVRWSPGHETGDSVVDARLQKLHTDLRTVPAHQRHALPEEVGVGAADVVAGIGCAAVAGVAGLTFGLGAWKLGEIVVGWFN